MVFPFLKMGFRKFKANWDGDICSVNITLISLIRSLTKGLPTSMLIDKELVTDPTEIAEGFNSYFSSIAEKLQQNSGVFNNTFSKYLNTPLEFNFLFRSVDANEVLLIIDLLKIKKSSGPGSIPTEIAEGFNS